MTSRNDFPTSVVQQKLLISADLHSALMQQFLTGVYTGLFAVTIFTCLQREVYTSSIKRIIIGSMASLYAMTALTCVTNWMDVTILLCDQSLTRLSTALASATFSVPPALSITGVLSQNIVLLLADGLMVRACALYCKETPITNRDEVWRCFHACGSSLRRSLVPIGLLVIETALVLGSSAFYILVNLGSGPWDPIFTCIVADYLGGAMAISVVATSLAATFLICRQIYTHTKTLPGSARSRYERVIDTLIQSCGMYSAAVIGLAVVQLLVASGPSTSFRLTVYAIENYVTSFGNIMAVGSLPNADDRATGNFVCSTS
ncbi:hypothetical protein D9613_012650 [Agrocybe pediades]|uniref:Uncharacterized protein n=1 Tax=Agrocybe pediades TaxID=84607 RepID=A0A8H4QWP1_9AGAR|nr:hypothetical protein D9613_012650 [Agrocybe pediades]